MYQANVEIYSDQTNAAVMRHPGRRFPGLLVQGDSLSILCSQADEACRQLKAKDHEKACAALNQLRNALQTNLNHYKHVLAEHDLPLPFSS